MVQSGFSRHAPSSWNYEDKSNSNVKKHGVMMIITIKLMYPNENTGMSHHVHGTIMMINL